MAVALVGPNHKDATRVQPFSVAAFDGKPVPPRAWNVEHYIPHRVPTLLYGDGAAGKTTLTLQLAAAKAVGERWLGLETRPGRTLYLSAEDDNDELHRRVDCIRADRGAHWSDLGDLMLWPLVGEDPILGAFIPPKQTVVPTKLFDQLEERVRDTMIDTVILDTLSDVFSGSENDRAQARQFIGILRGLCLRTDTSLLMLAHPSLSGMASGSGSSGTTGWSNAVRSRLYLYTPKEARDDARTLQVMKANYGPKNLSRNLRWDRGLYVLINDTDTEAKRKHAAEAADECFLRLLDAYTKQGRDVSPNPSSSYAPALFSADRAGGGIGKADLAAAMNRLMHAGTIKVETFGPPSKQRQRIIRTVTP